MFICGLDVTISAFSVWVLHPYTPPLSIQVLLMFIGRSEVLATWDPLQVLGCGLDL